MKITHLIISFIGFTLMTSNALLAQSPKIDDVNIEELEKKAEAGDAKSQHALGFNLTLLSPDQEVQKKGLYWLNKAIEQKYPKSMNFVAGLLLTKAKIAQGDINVSTSEQTAAALLDSSTDPIEDALELYREASMRGDGNSSFTLGLLYCFGQNVQKDVPLAIKWLEKAWAQKEPQAATLLGMIYEKGMAGDKDIDKALSYYQQAGKGGDSQAYGILAEFYRQGKDCEQDIDQFIYWVNKGVEKNNPLCLHFLGCSYGYGFGSTWNQDLAIKYLTKSAEQGYVEAYKELGNIYMGLTGGKKNAQKAFYWYDKAAQKGNAEAQRSLGIMYYTGDGVKQDIDTAAKWFQQAWEQQDIPSLTYLALIILQTANNDEEKEKGIQAIRLASNHRDLPALTQLAILEQNKHPYIAYFNAVTCADHHNPHAQHLLSQLYKLGTGVTKNEERSEYWQKQAELNGWTPESKPPFEIKNLISEWIPKASQGDSESQWKLCHYHLFANAYSQNISNGLYWLKRAVDQNNPSAIMTLGQMHLAGQFVKKDEIKGLKLLNKAVELDHPEAYGYLANAYYGGLGVKQDYKKAFDIAMKGALKNDVNSQGILASLYLLGSGVKQNETKAREWFAKAAENGCANSQCQIGKHYFIEQNIDKMLYWLTLASDQGNMEARGLLGLYYVQGTTNEDKEKGLAYLEMANQDNQAQIIYNLGILYENGNKLITKDLQKAYAYYRKAASLGDPQAIEKLKTFKP